MTRTGTGPSSRAAPPRARLTDEELAQIVRRLDRASQ